MSETKKAASVNTAFVKPRLHRFPPLRKPWMNEVTHTLSLEPEDYQKQLKEGFQEGVNRGFEQGLQQGKEEGFQEGNRLGYEDGFRKGVQEGRQEGKSLFTHAAEPLEEIAAHVRAFLEQYEQRRRSELLQLVEKVTRQVIRCELALQPTQLLALVEEALSGLPAEPAQLKVLLNPDEFARINDVEPERVQEWGLTAEPSLEQGECRVITETMEMDVGCQHRLQQCMDVLQQNLLPEQDDE